MRKCLKLAAFAVIAWWVPFTAQALTCPAPQPGVVRVKLIDPAATVTSRKSLQQINASTTGHDLAGKGKRALGMTESKLASSIIISFAGQNIQRAQTKTTCVTVTRIDARFGHTELIVSVPREYHQGTCKFNVVYRHEMAHVDVARRTVRKYATVLRRELEREIQKNNPMNARTMRVGESAHQKRLQAVISSVGKRFEAEANALHDKIDAPGSTYAADGACKGW